LQNKEYKLIIKNQDLSLKEPEKNKKEIFYNE